MINDRYMYVSVPQVSFPINRWLPFPGTRITVQSTAVPLAHSTAMDCQKKAYRSYPVMPVLFAAATHHIVIIIIYYFNERHALDLLVTRTVVLILAGDILRNGRSSQLVVAQKAA
jgi:hypothetical protein